MQEERVNYGEAIQRVTLGEGFFQVPLPYFLHSSMLLFHDGNYYSCINIKAGTNNLFNKLNTSTIFKGSDLTKKYKSKYSKNNKYPGWECLWKGSDVFSKLKCKMHKTWLNKLPIFSRFYPIIKDKIFTAIILAWFDIDPQHQNILVENDFWKNISNIIVFRPNPEIGVKNILPIGAGYNFLSKFPNDNEYGGLTKYVEQATIEEWSSILESDEMINRAQECYAEIIRNKENGELNKEEEQGLIRYVYTQVRERIDPLFNQLTIYNNVPVSSFCDRLNNAN